MIVDRLPKPSLALATAAALLSAAAFAHAQTETAAKAQTLLDVNPLIGDYEIEVIAADGGALRLEGAVANEIDRTLAVGIAALITGDRERVESALGLEAEMPEEAAGLHAEFQDLTTLARLQQRLRWQVSNLGLDVEPEVERGVVRLRGQVGTSATKDRMATVAASTEGVYEVFNYISVDPALIPDERGAQGRAEQAEREDAWIRSRLRALLKSDSTVNDRRVEIKVRDGKIVLRGSVTSSAERRVAETIAREIPGASEVDSRLIIERPL